MSRIEQSAGMPIPLMDNRNQTLAVPDGWTPYDKLGIYCSNIYSPENCLRRPAAIGPLSTLAIEQSGAQLVKPGVDNYKYLLNVAFYKPSLYQEFEEITSVHGMEIPTIGFKNMVHGENQFKKLDFAPGELWRMARIGLVDNLPRLAVPHIRFNTAAVSVLAQDHYSFDNSRFYKREPSTQTYAPVTGNAEEFKLAIHGTDVQARVRVMSKFLGI